jgi:SAM-dependent methyltransferase
MVRMESSIVGVRTARAERGDAAPAQAPLGRAEGELAAPDREGVDATHPGAAASPGGPGAGPGAEPDDWQRWLASPPGRYMLAWEQAQLDEAVGDVFGYHALQCGASALDALRANRMPHRVHALLDGEPLPSFDGARVRIQHFEELPFDTQSLDLVVLPHVLEFAQAPHQVLREADRVLRPEGRLIVTGLNPVSLWGARQLSVGGLLRPFLPRQAHFIGVPRLRDWCQLLSFDVGRARYGCWRPPCRTQLWIDRTRFMERAGDRWWPICGAVYLVAATKRVHGMRLVGRAFKRPVAARADAAAPARVSARQRDAYR